MATAQQLAAAQGECQGLTTALAAKDQELAAAQQVGGMVIRSVSWCVRVTSASPKGRSVNPGDCLDGGA